MGYISPLMATRSVKDTIRFYTEKLGFTKGMTFPTAEDPEYVDLSKDGAVLMFVPAASMGLDEGAALGTGMTLYVEIDGGIDAYYEDLRGKGVKIVEDIKDEPFGIRDFTIEDSNGYRLTFSRPIGKQCMSCGMPMARLEDFGGGNPASMYCRYCSNPDGSLKSYEEVLGGVIGFMMSTQGLDRSTAESKAKDHLAKMPAWSGG